LILFKKLILDKDIKIFSLLIIRKKMYKIKQYRICKNLAQSMAIANIKRKEKVERHTKYNKIFSSTFLKII
tara:strand:+ start:174 stop:386 length:213 start_codon:yes stop_codon:yes gene_type:complete